MSSLLSAFRSIADTTLPRDLAAAVVLALIVATSLVWCATLMGEL
ncbi:hypothetical protein [Breoghania sp.]|nr:hypothetical protein [Breoghania sp.]